MPVEAISDSITRHCLTEQQRSSERGAGPWARLTIPVVKPDRWLVSELHAGIRELERIRRETDAAMALLVGALPVSRDGVAGLARICGVSNREARKRQAIAKVVSEVAGAGDALSSATLSAEHVAAVAPVAGREGAAELLVGAELLSPEQLQERVEQHRISLLGPSDAHTRHHDRRTLRFFNGPDGMVGVNGLLPPVEGLTLKQKLSALTDARWRDAHPERAETLGGHGGDTREQRMVDALLELTGVGRPPADATVRPDGSASAAEPSTTLPATTVKTAKPAVVIVFDVERYEATLLGHGPVPPHESLFDSVKYDLYLHYRNTSGEVLKFGRARREPTLIQKLAVLVRDRHCCYPGCTAPPDRCEIHHFNEWLHDRGLTDVEALGLMCPAHHRHIHVENLVAVRGPANEVSIIDRATGRTVAQAKAIDRRGSPAR